MILAADMILGGALIVVGVVISKVDARPARGQGTQVAGICGYFHRNCVGYPDHLSRSERIGVRQAT